MYLIQSYYRSPIYITHPKAVGYVKTLAEAKAIVGEKNRKAISNHYSYIKLRHIGGAA